ncbi:MAG: sodium-dependent bicarbonate transport family permease [Burkholderiales bacterium]|nr:MAG: sodium-dependent bicarbonate transport family permease [Burkholderiales bacterium]
MDPVVLFFLLGVFARLVRSDLRLPEALYETLSIFLLLAIGIKGGVELAKLPLAPLLPQIVAAALLGFAIPFVAFPVLRGLGRFGAPDAASIAAHYGSVSVVTFAVAQSVLIKSGIEHEAHMPLLVAVMEAPGIIAGVLLARLRELRSVRWSQLGAEVFFGKSILLLLGGLAIGAIAGPRGIEPIAPVFIDLFRGVLALFLLEMGLVAGARLGELRRAGPVLLAVGLVAPVVFGTLGALTGAALGLSVGGVALLATLAGSASYIAAPTAMRIAVPEATPALSIGISLGVTFPFNIMLGVPFYIWLAGLLGGG